MPEQHPHHDQSSSFESAKFGTSSGSDAVAERTLQMDRVLEAAIREEASDIHINVGKPPVFSINGSLVAAETKALDSKQVTAAMKSIASDQAQQRLMEKGSADFALDFKDGEARFRVNMARAQGETYLTLRRLPNKLLTPEEIGLPKEVLQLADSPRGLISVTGPVGSGKTTTLGTIINYISQRSRRKIIAIEEPTEIKFPHGKGLVLQREVPNDVPTFQQGLVDALRQAPDVIVLGEMREIETMRVAVTAAETGHLVLATLHTSSAAETVNRLVDSFPEGEREQIRMQLSTALKGVLCQQLLKRISGEGRVAALEFLKVTPAIAHQIREGQTHRIPDSIQTGKKEGMRLLDEELFRLVSEGVVAPEEALRKANDRRELQGRLDQLDLEG